MTEAKIDMPRILTHHILKEWRERMGYTQDEACAELGCSTRAWGQWEKGEQEPPLYIGLAMDALALGIKPWRRP